MNYRADELPPEIEDSIASWGYRLIKRTTETGMNIIGVHEVYFDSEGGVVIASEDPVAPEFGYMGGNEENLPAMEEAVLEGVRWTYEAMAMAFEEPVLSMTDIDNTISVPLEDKWVPDEEDS